MKVAVLTGGHVYDVIALNTLFRSLPGIDAYLQHTADFTFDWGGHAARYDAVVFYPLFRTPLLEESRELEMGKRELQAIFERGQGVVVLHHALLSWPDWTFWDDVVGIENRRQTKGQYHEGQKMVCTVADHRHPITQDVADFTIVDETYNIAPPNADSHVLLKTGNPKSMLCIAWTRAVGNSKVFAFACGHDRLAYENPAFRQVLRNALLWAAGRGEAP